MSTPEAPSQGLSTTIVELGSHVGSHLGFTDWAVLSQDDVNVFADLTDDHNFIHVDPARAASTTFGGTIVHGYLSVAMLAPASLQLLRVEGTSMGINYGIDKLRFPGPLPVGARFRTGMELTEVGEIKGGVQAGVTAAIEVEGSERPAVVADLLFRYYA